MAALICGRRVLATRSSLFKIPKRNHEQGYYVVLPEIGEDLPEKNPLLKEDTLLPTFNPISVERCIAATGKQSIEFELGIKEVERNLEGSQAADFFKDVLEPLENLEIPLQTSMNISRLLFLGQAALMPQSVYIGILQRGQIAVQSKYNSKPIFELCKKQYEESQNLTEEQKRILHTYIRVGRGKGLDLGERGNAYLRWSERAISDKSEEFRRKNAIASNLFKHKVRDPKVMEEFPEEYLKLVADDPTQYKTGPWTITLEGGIRTMFMEYCPNSLLRWNVWHASVLVCSNFGEEELETSTLVNGITNEKNSLARTLGYSNFAEYSLTSKMAGSLDNVNDFLHRLRDRAYPRQVEEIKELELFAQENGHIGKFEQWDVPYWARKQKQAWYKYDDKVIKQYFPVPQVIDGLFKLVKNLFNVEIVQRDDVEVWHKSVTFHDVYDLDISSSEPVGSFYLSPYALRENVSVPEMEPNGWCLSIRHRSEICGVKPLTSVVTAHPMPKDDGTPSLMTVGSVNRMFQNFGEALQQLLTRTKSAHVAGTAGIEWDAVNTSNYLMSHFAYEPDVLKSISRHYKTNEPLSDEMIQNIIKSRTHLIGFYLCQELYKCRLDLDLYAVQKVWERVMKPLWKEHFVFPEDKRDSHVCSWEEVFSYDRGGAYFCSLWSKMLGADVYSAFQEVPANDSESRRKIGQRYKETFLYSGGSKSPSEVFRLFRGRDPSYESLIKSLNL
ncbi:hypothetical protein QAD02_019642 [Eretmocerus hayati]|uniref:Uncharacterized protein n=1 Tax=Eretmocerus hayati TaxID=131215 RepID=A0ACC2PPY9_9HYME|nr:hypothetical protein QAD02_019642 [Eretmocerus hayati]